jgi:hypothetical protein
MNWKPHIWLFIVYKLKFTGLNLKYSKGLQHCGNASRMELSIKSRFIWSAVPWKDLNLGHSLYASYLYCWTWIQTRNYLKRQTNNACWIPGVFAAFIFRCFCWVLVYHHQTILFFINTNKKADLGFLVAYLLKPAYIGTCSRHILRSHKWKKENKIVTENIWCLFNSH